MPHAFRAGNYGGMNIPDYCAASDLNSVIMVQIKDENALDHLDAIAAIEDVDQLFIGLADLSQFMEVNFPLPELDMAIDRIIAASRRNGIMLFVCGSDQALLRNARRKLIFDARK